MKHFFYLHVFLLFFLNIPAQKTGEFFEKSLEYKIPFTTTQYSTKNGLIQNQVIDVKANAEGLLFLSTGNGIYTFNGYDLKEIDIDKSYRRHFFHALVWNETYKILAGYDSYGNLCQILPELKIISLPGVRFQRLTGPGNDQLFLGSDQGDIYSVQLPQLKPKKLNFKIPPPLAALLQVDSLIYASSASGLYCYNLRSEKTEKISTTGFIKLEQNTYSHKIFGLTNDRVIEVATNKEVFSTTLKNEKDKFADIQFIGRDDFYLSTGKGLYHYAQGKTTLYSTDNALSSNALHTMLYNKQQACLFIGTTDKGLMKLQFKNAFSLYKNQGLAESSLSSIIKTHDGKVLFAETCCNVHELVADTIINYNNSKAYYSVLAEINNQLLCGTWGDGLYVCNEAGITDKIKFPAIPDNTPLSIFKDRTGVIWIGTTRGMAKGGSLKTIHPVFISSIKSTVNIIYELKNGDLCFGGVDGFWITDGTIIKTKIGKEEGLRSNSVRSFYEDNENKLWIGTYGGGLYCYDAGKLTSVNSKKGCGLFEDAFTLAPDSYGNLYMTSNYGLWSISLKALDNFYKNKTNFLIPAHYTEENGLLNTEFNGAFQNNYLEITKNHFYFPSIEGLVSFTADTLPYRKLQTKIESVIVNDSSSVSTNTVFSRNTFFLKFKVSCVNFSSRNNVFFQYKLSGSNSDEWSIPQKESAFNFYLLPPGNYQLAVRAIDSSNDPDPAEVIYEFKIEAYFYETLWFKICVAISGIALAFFIARNRVRSHQKKAAEKEFYARRIAEIELRAVQSQLNPHFIFNCLNTIKYFILDHDFEKANKGLNHFSKLLRDVLNNSEKFTIPLEKEIQFITDYLELEKMRLQDQLEVSITSDLTYDHILLPAMLIQPHVENAIKHGISNLEHKKGVLTISFKQNQSFIECTIIDNGIGRTASSKISKLPSHKSFGINLTKDKSEILKKNHNIEIITSFTDLYTEAGEPIGTQVIIKIPLQHENSNN